MTHPPSSARDFPGTPVTRRPPPLLTRQPPRRDCAPAPPTVVPTVQGACLDCPSRVPPIAASRDRPDRNLARPPTRGPQRIPTVRLPQRPRERALLRAVGPLRTALPFRALTQGLCALCPRNKPFSRARRGPVGAPVLYTLSDGRRCRVVRARLGSCAPYPVSIDLHAFLERSPALLCVSGSASLCPQGVQNLHRVWF